MSTTNPYAPLWSDFLSISSGRTLEVLQDDRVHRHLRTRTYGQAMRSWDIVTRPNHLSITGDITGEWDFHHTYDMFDFFDTSCRAAYSDGAPQLDVNFWAKTLVPQQRESWSVYSPKVFLDLVREELEKTVSDGCISREEAAVTLRDAANYGSDSEAEAYDWADRNLDVRDDVFEEISLRAPKIKFLFALYAIVTTIQEYQAK